MISCIAIDDEPLALKQMVSYIEKTPFLELKKSFYSALRAMEYINENQVDLMFVDIQMPDFSGLDFAKMVGTKSKIIFTTAYREYALEGFQLDAVDYLLKPIGYDDFLKTAIKTQERYFSVTEDDITVNHTEKFLFIKSEYKIIRIELQNIKYIEGMSDYVRIHMIDKKPIMALMAMKKIVEYLPRESFMRVHRSFIVNLQQVSVIERNRIVFDSDVYIPISEQYKEEFQHFLDANFLK
jgi:two-component system LytT family response regulator